MQLRRRSSIWFPYFSCKLPFPPERRCVTISIPGRQHPSLPLVVTWLVCLPAYIDLQNKVWMIQARIINSVVRRDKMFECIAEPAIASLEPCTSSFLTYLKFISAKKAVFNIVPLVFRPILLQLPQHAVISGSQFVAEPFPPTSSAQGILGKCTST